MRRGGVCVDRRVVAWRRRVDDWTFGLVDRERRPKPALAAVERRLPTRRSGASAPLGPRVSVVVCAYNAAETIERVPGRRSTRSTYPNFEIIVVNDGSTRWHGSEIGRRAARRRSSAVMDFDERRPERGAQHRARACDWRDRGVHRRRRAGSDWLAYLVQPFLDVGRGRLGRTNVCPPTTRARPVRGASAGWSDPRAARRSYRRARAGLQLAFRARRAAGDRRVQPDLPSRRRRRGCLLAAAGPRLAHWLRAGGARLAPPSRDDQGATGASRSATVKAKRG